MHSKVWMFLGILVAQSLSGFAHAGRTASYYPNWASANAACAEKQPWGCNANADGSALALQYCGAGFHDVYASLNQVDFFDYCARVVACVAPQVVDSQTGACVAPVTCTAQEVMTGGSWANPTGLTVYVPSVPVCSGGCTVGVDSTNAAGGWSGRKTGATCAVENMAPIAEAMKDQAGESATAASGSATTADAAATSAENAATAAAASATAAEASAAAAAAAAASKAGASDATVIGSAAWWQAVQAAAQASAASTAASQARAAATSAATAAAAARAAATDASSAGSTAGSAASAAQVATTMATIAAQQAAAAEAAAVAAIQGGIATTQAGVAGGQATTAAGKAAEAAAAASQAANPTTTCLPGAPGCPTKIDESGTGTAMPFDPAALVAGTGVDALETNSSATDKPDVGWTMALPQSSSGCETISFHFRNATLEFPDSSQCQHMHEARDMFGYLLAALTAYGIVLAFLGARER